MKKLFYGKLLIKLIFILAFFLPSADGFLEAATSPDVIAFRVMKNSGYLSPLKWYQENIKLKGSPQSLTVDGYEAVRDGRTVYVNAANIGDNKFYANLYIISYNQQAESQTIDIFGQILTHWKFNTNLSLAEKNKVRKDTKRLADLADIKLALDNYKKGHGGYPPSLSAGSYLVGKSISVWPSWQATLSKDLGLTLPVDPNNKLGSCPGFDAITCWNQAEKKFYDQTDNNEFNLPAGSQVYVYLYNVNGSYSLCALLESDYSISSSSLLPGVCPNLGAHTIGYAGAANP